MKTNLKKPLLFVSASILSLLLLGRQLGYLIHLIKTCDEYTHLAVIPLVSGYFLWSLRKGFAQNRGNPFPGISITASGVIFGILINFFYRGNPENALSLKAAGVIMVIYGLFIFLWGMNSFRKTIFPFFFLLLAIPIPPHVLDSVIRFLQWGSAVMVGGIYTLLGQDYLRDGASFHLDTLSITIAPECSGIRSTMALLITGAVATEMFLKNLWNKTWMLLLIIPLSLLKNAIRIVTITMLAEYVDIKWLTDSYLHHSGGIFFYLIVLAIFFPTLFLLSKIETSRS